ncbi:hypothetical protein EPUL_004988, partial [Erysiphe pulchra]
QQTLRLARPGTLDDALAHALEFEAANKHLTEVTTSNSDLKDPDVGIAAKVDIFAATGYKPTRRDNTPKVARGIERLQEYNFTVEHRAGKSHNNADALSRRPCPSDCKHCSKIEEKESCLRTTVMDENWLPKSLQKDQEDDPELNLLLNWKTKGQRPRWEDVSPLNSRVKSYWAQWDSLILEDGLLKRSLENEEGVAARNQLVIPRSRVPEVLRKLHDGTSGGHFGIKKTLEKVRERFYWVNCKEDVKDWCRKCRLCASSNGPRGSRRAPMKQYNVGSPLERVAIDISGPFPETEDGNKYILVAMDYFTKWVEAYAIPNQEASTVADILVKEMFSRLGVPLELHSDQGRNFESSLFQGVCELLGIKKTRTTALHPQSDGMVERMNRTVGKYLTKVVSDHQRDWDKYLHLFTMAYRSSVQESTGETPACIMFGREIRLPCDLEFGCKPGVEMAGEDYVSNLKGRLHYIHEKVRQNLQIASDRMKTRYDSKAAEGGFEAGDLVWLYNPQRRRGFSPKLQKDWEGPYKVIKRINDVVYRIQRLPRGKKRVVHVNRLAKYEADYDSQDETKRVTTLVKEQEEMSFERFMANYGGTGRARFGITTEQQQDLFSVPEEYSLAHCVAEDLRMSRGIARVFRKKFGRVPELVDQQPRPGRTLRLPDGERHLFYLVTKRFSHGKPTYEIMWDTLMSLRSEITRLRVKKLAVPKLGCGLDQLNWRIVRNMLEVIFQGTGIQILVCGFNPRGCSTTGKTVQCYFQQNGRCRMGDTCRFSHSFQGQAKMDQATMEFFKQALEQMSLKLENKMEENSKSLKSDIDIKMDENGKFLENKFSSLENKLEHELSSIKNQIENMEAEIDECSRKVEECSRDVDQKFDEYSRKVDRKLKDYSLTLEERFSKMAMEPRNFADSSFKIGNNCEMARMKISPPTFDGKTPWCTYQKQFEAAAKANGWDEGEKVTALIVALRGEALNILQVIPASQQGNYEALITKLQMRYGDAHLQQVYHAQIKGRQQKNAESLQEFEADIARLVRLAYPTAPDSFLEQLAVQTFVDGLKDAETQQTLRLARPRTLDDALAHALEFEAAKQASNRSHNKVRRSVDDSAESEESFEEAVLRVIQQQRSKGPRCWNCGESGHIRRN